MLPERNRKPDFNKRRRLHLPRKHQFLGLIFILLNAVNVKQKSGSHSFNYQPKQKKKWFLLLLNDFLLDFLRFVCAIFIFICSFENRPNSFFNVSFMENFTKMFIFGCVIKIILPRILIDKIFPSDSETAIVINWVR